MIEFIMKLLFQCKMRGLIDISIDVVEGLPAAQNAAWGHIFEVMTGLQESLEKVGPMVIKEMISCHLEK